MRVGLISLGCAKNLVDAEIMLGSLLKDGVEITNDAESADALIVNTCSFIDAAQEESVDTILESAQVREAQNREQALIVSGCLPQRFRDELPKLLPEVDAFMGIDQVTQVSDIVRQALQHRAERMRNAKRGTRNSKSRKPKPLAPDSSLTAAANRQWSIVNRRSFAPPVDVHPRPNYIPDYATPRFRLTPRHFAYVKIAEGCNHPCSFCIIPRMRGSHRSRPPADIVAEARQLIADGVKELNLISQDSTYYGLDLRPNRAGSIAAPETFAAAAKALPADTPTLCTLLRDLNALPGDFWIRLLYTHPAHWTDELIRTIAECPKVARYIDMPLQHIHENMLERMRRETSQQYIVDLIRRIRAGIPGIAVRTTFIVGFPGETEACFRTLLDFIHETKFERLGVFTYSREEGTRAAKMENQVPEGIRKRRRDLAMAGQLKVARKISRAFVGRTIKVLVEQKTGVEDLPRANVFSWEHGLIREGEPRRSTPGSRTFLVARSEADAPDIDGRVYVRGRLRPGEFALVRITGHTDYDLMAEPA
ncbi:MAG: 30S ribosomal protein S12 methylthiotransferase RimO [Verrucomicrobia bacterium]|nr:MAG: 30S ribosomal protein S12 methylthiotransferase RimO [Verrucomicrobiota bacterium]